VKQAAEHGPPNNPVSDRQPVSMLVGRSLSDVLTIEPRRLRSVVIELCDVRLPYRVDAAAQSKPSRRNAVKHQA